MHYDRYLLYCIDKFVATLSFIIYTIPGVRSRFLPTVTLGFRQFGFEPFEIARLPE
jgi:hypothetical protein